MRLDAHFDMLPMRAFQRGPSGSIMPQGGKGSNIEAPAPDPNIGLAQKEMSNLSTQYMDLWKNDIWPGLKEQSAVQEGRANEQFAFDKQMQERQAAIADEQYNRYKEKFLPMQDEIIKEAQDYDTAGNRERIAGEALGDVENQFAISRANRAREGAAYGIDPSSGRYAGAANAEGVMEAATKASAATRARDAAVQLGWAKKMDAIGLGSGIFGNQATSTGLALNAGSSAMAAGQIPIANYGAMGSSSQQASGQAIQGWNQVGSLGVQKYNSDVSAFNAQQQANATTSAGIGSAIGAIGGAALKYGPALATAMSDIRVKQNIEVVGVLPNGLTVYEFEYKPEFRDEKFAGHGRFRGLMAHEVEKVIPEAVTVMDNGYQAIDYSKVQ